MEILVTGGLGYIGSHTVIELLNRHYKVVIVDDLSNSSKDILEKIYAISGKTPTFYKTDLRNIEDIKSIFAVHNFNAVIHFAAHKIVEESVKKPLDYYDNNITSSLVVFKCMRDFGVKSIIFSSTAAVYGTQDHPPIKENFKSDKSNSPYGRSKAFTELILKDFSSTDKAISALSLRYFNPVGSDKEGALGDNVQKNTPNLISTIVRVASGKQNKLKVYGNDYPTKDGTGVRDYLHVVDLAIGHVAALEYSLKTPGYDVINLGSGKGTSVLELIDIFERVNNVTVPYVIEKRREGDVASSWADVTKAKELLDWQVTYSLQDMCRDAWNSYLKNNI